VEEQKINGFIKSETVFGGEESHDADAGLPGCNRDSQPEDTESARILKQAKKQCILVTYARARKLKFVF